MLLFFFFRNVVPVTECDKVIMARNENPAGPVQHLMKRYPCICNDISDCPRKQHSLYGDSEQRRLPAERRCDWPEPRGGGGFFPPSSPPDWQLLSFSLLLSSPPILEDRAMRRQ